jgi:hypothetical protein
MKPRPFKSHLIPFTDQIKAWRREGDTWQEVSDKLASLGCKTDASALCRFIGRINRRPYPRGAEPEQPSPRRTTTQIRSKKEAPIPEASLSIDPVKPHEFTFKKFEN